MQPKHSVLILILLILGCGSAATAVSWEAAARVSGIINSDFKGRTNADDVDVLNTKLSTVASIEAGDGFLVRLGFDLQRYDFDLPASVPLSHTLQSFALILGADLQLGEAWLARVEIQPGFYSGNHGIEGDDFNIPLVVGGSFFVNSELQFVLGLSVDLNRRYPVLPAAGLRWRITREWVLNAVLPTPRLEYSFNPNLTLYAGADLRIDTYRVDGSLGRAHDLPELDNAVVEYSQFRIGVGASWKINSSATLEIEAGAVPVHEIDYHRTDVRFHSTNVPPYAGILFKAAF
jgi:hypothetical protein